LRPLVTTLSAKPLLLGRELRRDAKRPGLRLRLLPEASRLGVAGIAQEVERVLAEKGRSVLTKIATFRSPLR